MTTFPDVADEHLIGADEQSTSKFRVLVKASGKDDKVAIRIDRDDGDGNHTSASSFVISGDEANALLIALMNEIG